MENFAKKCKWSFLLTAVGLFAFFSCGKLDKTENLVNSQESSFVRGEAAVNITGTVNDPTTCLPIAGATVSSGSFTATTDGNGHFSIPAASVGDSELVTVSKDGHIDYTFPVGYAGLTDADWTIGLPPRQDCVWVGPNEGAWYRVNVSGVEYIIDIRRGSVDAWTQVCVGPGGTAFGGGIPLAFAITGLSTETPGSSAVFNSPVDVRYNPLAALGSKGGIGSVNGNVAAAAAAAGSSGAIITALVDDINALLADAGGAGAGGADAATVEAIGDLLYTGGGFSVSPSGQFVVEIDLPSNYIPSAGFLTDTGLLVLPSEDGVIITDGTGDPITTAQVLDVFDVIADLIHQGTGGG